MRMLQVVLFKMFPDRDVLAQKQRRLDLDGKEPLLMERRNRRCPS